MTWGKALRAAWIALFTTLVALWAAEQDFFGLESRSSESADDVLQRAGVIGYHYPEPHGPRPGRDRVRVIYIDEAGLEALRPEWPGWPPGYLNLALMVQDLARAPRVQPARGVFVDLEITGENLTLSTQAEFEQLVDTLGTLTGANMNAGAGWGSVEGCRHDPLTKLACMVEWNGVPIVLAGGEPSGPPQTEMPSPRARLEAVAQLSPTLVHTHSYPVVAAALPKGQIRPVADTDAYDLYPAAAMYAVDCLVRARAVMRDVCGVPAIEKARLAAQAFKRAPAANPPMPTWGDVRAGWSQPQAVVWSSDASPRQKALWRQTSNEEQPDCSERPGRFFDKEPVQSTGQACIYTLSLGYDRIVAGIGLSLEEDYPDLLGDKLILIGTHFRSSDWAPTPLHGALPGVQYHAMALDNLLEHGRQYRRHGGDGLAPGELLSALVTFLMLFVVNVASLWKRQITVRAGLKPVVAIGWYLALALIIGLGLVAWIWAIEVLLRSVVINWLGVIGTVCAAVWITARTDIGTDLGDWMKRFPPGRAIVSGLAAFQKSLHLPQTKPQQDEP